MGILSWSVALVPGAGGALASNAPAAEPAQAGGLLASATIAESGGTITIGPGAPALAGARIEVGPGALGSNTAIAVSAPEGAKPPLFPHVPIMHVAESAILPAPIEITIPYTDAFVDEFGAQDESVLSIYARDDDGLWSWVSSRVDTRANSVTAHVTMPGTWVVAPTWLLRPWQQYELVGDGFVQGGRNALVIHGWNASPWDACQLALMQGISSRYDHVVAYAYPSAVDIDDSARWLRNEVLSRYPQTSFDVIGFSEGGLVARAAIEPGAWNGGRTISGNVARLITIATPHTGLVGGLHASVLGDVASEQMTAGSAFLRALNGWVPSSSPPYITIAGDGSPDHASDTLVGVDSALGRGAFRASSTSILPLLHAPTYGAERAMPCDSSVYRAITQR